MPKASNVIPFPRQNRNTLLADIAPMVSMVMAAAEMRAMSDATLAALAHEYEPGQIWETVEQFVTATNVFTAMADACNGAAARLSAVEAL